MNLICWPRLYVRVEARRVARGRLPSCFEVDAEFLSYELTPYFNTVLSIVNSPPWVEVSTPELIQIRAEAYETWWSLSKADPNEPELQDNDIRPSEFKAGSSEALAISINAYEMLLNADPNNRNAREHLSKLHRGEDAEQREWYCFAD